MKHGHLVSLALALPALLLGACADNSQAGTTGGAGSGGGGTMGSAATIDCTMDTGTASPEAISDFEDGSGSVLPNGDRNGGWYTYADPTATCAVMPAPHASAGAAEIPNGGRCASLFAMRLQGTGCTTWGAGVGTDLKAPAATDAGAPSGPKIVYDVTGYSGISFWSRADKGSSMRFKMPMTDETKVEDGGACVESATSKCSDDFGSNIALTTKWLKHTVMFSTMKQEAWGKVFAWNPAHVTSIQFQVPASAAFDVWIDDVVFIK